MCRSHWELTSYVHHHIAELADERRAFFPLARGDDGPPPRLSRLRRRLGIALIQLGRALADYDPAPGLPTPSASQQP